MLVVSVILQSLYPARTATSNYRVWDWVGCRASLGAMKTSYSDRNRTPNPWSSSPQYSHYIHLWSLVRNLRVQEPENNVKSDRKPCTVSTSVRVLKRTTTGDTWFEIKETSAVCVSAILPTLTDYTSSIASIQNSRLQNFFHRPHTTCTPHMHTVRPRSANITVQVC
jgi:hypothetical protein